MPKSLKRYRDKEKARKYRNMQRRLNYEIGNFSDGRRKRRWKWKECEAILDHLYPDRFLARLYNRSVVAIQIKRGRLKEMLAEI